MMDYVGIDVGSKELVIITRRKGKSSQPNVIANTAEKHQALVAHCKKLSKSARICLEATGVYHLDLAATLQHAGLNVMVVNPKAAHNFAKALSSRNKTDAVDAEILAQYAERMEFVPWKCPSRQIMEIRAYARHLAELSHQRTRLKNQLHAITSHRFTPDYLLRDSLTAITTLEQRIELITEHVLSIIEQDESIKAHYDLLVSVKGIADKSAIQLLGELLVLPENMTTRQWVAHAGLDPRQCSSGSSVNKKPHLSKVGNQRLRRALFMPALAAARWETHVKAYYQHLVNDNGLKKIQAVCAVMRKLLHAIHAMFKTGKLFDGGRFYHPSKVQTA